MTDEPRPGAVWLGVTRHPSTGIRLPEVFLPGILAAWKERGIAGTLSLSFGRETAPEAVINAPPGTWEITRGHTGTSIREYMTAAAREAERAGVTVEVEADHLIIIGSQSAALRRLTGDHAHAHISPEELERSLDYYRMCLDEAAEVGNMGCLTIDPSDLFWTEADHLPGERVRELFAERFPGVEGDELLSRYGKTQRFPAPGGRTVQVTVSELQAMRLALKFADSLRVSRELYDYTREALGHERFSVEIALDETAEPTGPRDTLFWLTEARAIGLPIHYVGPHLGFAKRVDYTGDLKLLERRTRQQHAISQGVCGALLSIHSGDGSSPYSGKGEGVYEALVRATGGELKFKISDVYFELLMDMMAALPAGSEGRRLFERIFDEVEGYLREQVKQGGPLNTPMLVEQLAQYDRDVARSPDRRRDSRAQFFRFHQFLALNLRDGSGRRHLREAIIGFVRGDANFRAAFDDEARALMLRMVDGLGLAD
ncbi:MAG: hypothetical protein J7M38_05135 [Armatimonadetes bacterium]|nr:hypothetical protein [Armatimonadota bacterium]